jgi:hypothetical protein
VADGNEHEDIGISPAAIAELKQKHGDRLSLVKAPDDTHWVIQRPTKAIWSMYVNDARKDGSDGNAVNDRLVLDCVVYPDRKQVAATLTEYAAFSGSLSNELGAMAGLSGDLDVKKL